MKKLRAVRYVLLVVICGIAGLKGRGQTVGDYRTAQAAVTWGTAANWQTWDGAKWTTASVTPGSGNDVYIQSGHTATLGANATCKNLFISTGTTSSTNGADAQVALTTNALSVSGKLSCYYGAVDIAVNSTTGLMITASNNLPNNVIIKTASSSGKIKIVGNSRSITINGEWGTGNIGSANTFDIEIALNVNQTATMGTSIKAYNWVLTSGTLDAGSNRVSANNGTSGQGDVTINSGATLLSDQTGSGNQVISRDGSNKMGTFSISTGGILRLSALAPTIDASAINNNGTVIYEKPNGQSFLNTGSDITSASINSYQNVIVSGSGTNVKLLTTSVTINGIFSIQGSASLSLNGFNLNYGTSSSLEYKGSAAQVTTTSEFPSTFSGMGGVVIDNSFGVTLDADKTVTNGTLTLTSGALKVSNYTLALNGAAIAGTASNLNTTSSSSLSFGGSSSGVFLPSSIAALNGLTINNPNGISLNSSPTINGVLKFISGNITTGAYKVIISATGSVTGNGASTGWVAGALQKNVAVGPTSVTFEIGDAINYRPVQIDFASVTNAGSLTISVTQSDGTHPSLDGSGVDPAKSLKRYFSILKNSIGFTKFDITFNFVSSDVNGVATSYVVRQYNGSIWSAPPGSSTATALSTKASGINSLNNVTNDFAIGEILPLQVTSTPSNVSVCVGGTATFTAASTSSPTTTVQWREKVGSNGYVDIANGGMYSGATTNTLTITGVTLGMSTNNYRAVFSNINGSASATATLTVNSLPAAPTVSVSQPCNGSTSGTVTISAPTGSGYSYSLDGSNYTNTTVFSLTPGSYPLSDKNSNGCISTVTTATVNTPANYWTGNTNSDWSVAGNWSCGVVPAATDNVVIPLTTNKPKLTASQTTIADVNIAAGTNITLADKTFIINGAISGTGVLIGSRTAKLIVGGTGGTGTLYFDGANDTTTNTLYSLTMSRNTGSISIGNKLYLINVLDVSGNGTVYPGGNVVLRSTEDSSARVAPVFGSITGNVVIERFIPARRAYRFITSSVTTQGTVKANWMEGQNNPVVNSANVNAFPGFGTHITGYAGSPDFDVTQNNAPSLFVYNNATQAWSNVNSTGSTLIAGFPYRLFVRGDRSVSLASNTPAPTNTILRAAGLLTTGTVIYNSTTSNPIIKGVNGAFSYVGNPYASPVDWNSLITNQVSPTYYMWDPNLNTRGGYASYNGSNDTRAPSNSSASRYIQTGQAFFIQAQGTAPTLQLREQDKASVYTHVFRGTESVSKLSVQLIYNDTAAKRITADGVTTLFNDDFSAFIGNEDSYKFMNLDENLAIQHADTILSIEGRPNLVTNDTLQLRIWQYRQSNYFLQFDASNFNAGATLFVKDAYLNTETQINSSDSTLIPFSLTSDSASFAADRFMIVLKPGSVLPVTITDVKAYQKGKGIQVDWISRSEANISHYEVEKSANGRDFEKAGLVTATGNSSMISYGWFDENPVEGNNFYRIRIVEKSGSVKYTQVVKVTIGKGNGSIAVLPNPVKGNAISLHFVNMQKGRYTISLYNNLGQQVLTRKIEHDGASATYSIPAGRLISKGTYRLNATNGESELNTTVLFE